MKDTSDKGSLLELAKAVHKELNRRRIGAPFRLRRGPKSRQTNTDGWLVSLGAFSGFQSRAELWLDRFTGHPRRQAYYGLHSYKRDGLAKLAQAAGQKFGKHLSIYERDWADESESFRLAQKLKNAAFGHPVYERYPDKPEFFYGIYEYGRAGLQRNKFERLVGRAADFFQSVAEAVSGDNSQSDRDTYQTVENRRAVAQHLRRERKGYVATLRKQSDNYICQICRFDFSKFYGELGNDFAEAHHIVPLSANSKLRTITVDDLVTVCANCHRMLHRMSGKPKDLADLKSRVRRGKRA